MEQNNEARRNRQIVIVLLIFGAVLAIASLSLRVLTAGEYEIKTIDLIFLVIPLLVVALATGKLRSLDLFGVKVDFADLWAAVGRTEIRDQVSDSTLLDALDELATAEKGSLQELRRQLLIGSQIEALEFKLGHGAYSGEAVRKYFEALSGSLRVVVVNESGEKLFAIYNAPDLISSLGDPEEGGYEDFAAWLNNGNREDRSELAKLPGFVGVGNALKENTSKRDALAMMEKLNTDILPVVNEEDRFIGTVGRSKLTAGLILAVTDQLEDR